VLIINPKSRKAKPLFMWTAEEILGEGKKR